MVINLLALIIKENEAMGLSLGKKIMKNLVIREHSTSTTNFMA